MKKIVIGILAHVDAGKTTLSESMLYLSGKIKKLGRVDNKDAYLDTYELEKTRGITIFSKQALFNIEDTEVILLDTPGHVDFSAEMERTLQVLDYAILVINGSDGIDSHTKTLWKLLRIYHIPVFIFINKMDQVGANRVELQEQVKKELSEGCIDFTAPFDEHFFEQIAMCDENLLESYLEGKEITKEHITRCITKQVIFPCFFGSALKLEGISEFMKAIHLYSRQKKYAKEFGSKIFKISRDNQGNRLTHMKITGGSLKVKDIIQDEKVNEIRIYSGGKYEVVTEAVKGEVCAVVGLANTKPGQGLGVEVSTDIPKLEGVLSYRILFKEEYNPREVLSKLRELEEEEPELHIVWNEELQEIQAKLMGEIQVEILQSLIKDRFQMEVTFDEGAIVYKETISNKVEGVGHFEPLRHYAEVHLLMEPLKVGSGLQFASECSEDLLEKNWQRLIISHLEEKRHRGVLTGAYITDMKITLVAGRAHKKHTEGGDFREATYRAVRQGLRQAESILLEPYYQFELEVPDKMVGRAMTDIERMSGEYQLIQTEQGKALLKGSAPVITMQNYQKEVIAYTKGQGRLTYALEGYKPCHNTEEVIKQLSYDVDRDIQNTADSVFCSHGSGFIVKWDEVKKYMHIESYLEKEKVEAHVDVESKEKEVAVEPSIGIDEINEIMNKTYYRNQGEKSIWRKKITQVNTLHSSQNREYHLRDKECYLLVDGYNIIFAWEELKALAKDNIEAARSRLLDVLCNYQGMTGYHIMVVFDAYRVVGHQVEITNYHNINVVYTKEAQTADHFIEKFVHQNYEKYKVTVATSDGLEQIIIRGKGCQLLSARELEERVTSTAKRQLEEYKVSQTISKNYLGDIITDPS